MRFGVDSQRRIDTILKFRARPQTISARHRPRSEWEQFSSRACATVRAQKTHRPTVEYLNDFLCDMRGDVKPLMSRNDNRARQNVTYPLFLRWRKNGDSRWNSSKQDWISLDDTRNRPD